MTTEESRPLVDQSNDAALIVLAVVTRKGYTKQEVSKQSRCSVRACEPR
jgi:hypothetical protein